MAQLNRYMCSPKNSKILDKNNTIIILADDAIKGMKNAGPKPLLEFNGLPIFLYQLEVINSIMPNSDILLVVGHNSSKFFTYYTANIDKFSKVRIIENESFDVSNSIESARLAVNASTTDNLIFIAGETIFKAQHLRSLIGKNSLISKEYEDSSDIGVIKTGQNLLSLTFTSNEKFFGMCSLTKNATNVFRKYLNSVKNRKMFLYQGITYLSNNGFDFLVIKDNSIDKVEKDKDNE